MYICICIWQHMWHGWFICGISAQESAGALVFNDSLSYIYLCIYIYIYIYICIYSSICDIAHSIYICVYIFSSTCDMADSYVAFLRRNWRLHSCLTIPYYVYVDMYIYIYIYNSICDITHSMYMYVHIYSTTCDMADSYATHALFCAGIGGCACL